MKRIIDYFYSNQDLQYKDFNAGLSPTLSSDSFIGVRTPILRDYAKKLYKEEPEVAEKFIRDLPHKYFEENQLHAFIISLIKDYDTSVKEVERFLPFVDNWATCDQLKPKPFTKNKDKLLDRIRVWIKSEHTYTCRFAIEMLMNHFLDEDFKPEYLELVASVKSEEYYVNMMVAWYFATAMAKQYEATVPYIEQHKLSDWVHRKTISKCVDSYRISSEQKEYLKSYRR
ncbi:MAG: DNA alkylation repair protein [Saccharofermentans sp.]|nr:DNA alkylation repair protein [Saccharofermentans sp.]